MAQTVPPVRPMLALPDAASTHRERPVGSRAPPWPLRPAEAEQRTADGRMAERQPAGLVRRSVSVSEAK
jgi:hypothetical protein